MKKLVFILLLVILLGGCASIAAERRATWEACLNTWIGQPVEALIQRVGFPTRTLIALNGNTVYVFAYRYTDSTAHISYSVGEHGLITWGPTTFNPYELHCTTFFEVDGEQKIISWRYEGNMYALPAMAASK